ncbi:transglutaminase-like domain-containing protein [Streptomyces sp.]|uniref:transglutaminase-like domain-containing protein n=1 Tax=Streptomyces sp. TaxID=1931 RepID=UPI002F3EBB71
MNGPRAAVLAGLLCAVALTVALALVDRPPGGLRGALRTAATALVVVSTACAGALLPLPDLGAARTEVQRVRATPDEPDPLQLLPTWAASRPRQRVLTVGLPAALRDSPPLWILLAYDDYDAAAGWHATPVLRRLAAPPDGSAGVTVTLDAAARLLPHPSRMLGAEPVLDYDRTAEALRSATPRTRYTVAAEPTGAARDGAPLPSTVPVPACARDALRPFTDGSDARVPLTDRLARLEDLLAGHGLLDRRAVDGDGCGALADVLRRGRGGSDQYATAFALAARVLGADSRVAVGYRPRGAVSADGRQEVYGSDALTWPQVAYPGRGWVDFWPFPDRSVAGLPASPPVTQRPSASPPVTSPPPGGEPGGGHQGVVLAVAVLAAALIAVAASAAAAALRRRAAARLDAERRARLPADRRILETWRRTLRAVEPGTLPAPTAHDVASSGSAGSLAALAELVDRTLYDPAATAGAVEVRLAERLAAAARAEARAARRRRPFSSRGPC